MDISNEELKEYLEHRKHGGHSIKRHQLIGTWVLQDNLDEYDYTEFKDDNTLVLVNIGHLAYPYFVGRVDFKYTRTGTWEMKDDSLIMNINPCQECSIDTSQIHILPNKEEEMRTMIAGWYDYLQRTQEESRNDTVTQRSSWAAFIDSSGEKIEAWRVDEETGHESCFYMVKKEE